MRSQLGQQGIPAGTKWGFRVSEGACMPSPSGGPSGGCAHPQKHPLSVTCAHTGPPLLRAAAARLLCHAHGLSGEEGRQTAQLCDEARSDQSRAHDHGDRDLRGLAAAHTLVTGLMRG